MFRHAENLGHAQKNIPTDRPKAGKVACIRSSRARSMQFRDEHYASCGLVHSVLLAAGGGVAVTVQSLQWERGKSLTPECAGLRLFQG